MLILGMAVTTLVNVLRLSSLVSFIALIALITCIVLFVFQSRVNSRDAKVADTVVSHAYTLFSSLIAKLMIETNNDVSNDGGFAKSNQKIIDKYSLNYRDAVELTDKIIKKANNQKIIKASQMRDIKSAVQNDCEVLKARAFKKVKDEE